jgi:hypothetical protein
MRLEAAGALNPVNRPVGGGVWQDEEAVTSPN